MVRTVAIEAIEFQREISQNHINQNTIPGTKIFTMCNSQIPSSEDTPRETQRVRGTKIPTKSYFSKGEEGLYMVTHGFQKKNHISLDSREKRVEDFELGKTYKTVDVKGK